MLALTAEQTMLQLTAVGVCGERFDAPIVVSNARHTEMIEEQLAAIGCQPQALILEPVGRKPLRRLRWQHSAPSTRARRCW